LESNIIIIADVIIIINTMVNKMHPPPHPNKNEIKA